MTALNVFLHAVKVGRLWVAGKRQLAFQYDANWLNALDAVPLSISLPLQTAVFDDELARPFFANLLPEAEQRRIIAGNIGVSEGNDYALLEEIGGECAGAVSLLPDGQAPESGGEYQPLSNGDLIELIAQLPKRPMLAGQAGIRLSLAGAQSKLPVFFDGQHISLPTGSLPSSHIIKPAISHLTNTVENEAFCMQLAQRVGLTVPAATVLHKQSSLYLVERYDRIDKQDKTIRLHQEDFCQAMAILPDMKYEKEGGPTLQACFQLLRDQSVQPVADIKSLLNWVIFNYLIGNADAHGKNLSLLLTEQGPRLAPFYDLLCTAVYPDLTERLAMRIGGKDKPEVIITRTWLKLADDVAIGDKLIISTLKKMSEQLPKAAHSLKASFVASHGECQIIDKIIAVIERRARKINNCLAAADDNENS